ncbi:MAG: hypothetical protein IH876_12660 [Gemmatimonadetes bacterium]|nr:hypothetical protein [Gemmatimonadota bacterium]
MGAVQCDPGNSIASSGAAKLLLYLADRRVGRPAVLRGLAQRYMRLGRETLDTARAHSGRRADQAVESVQPVEAPEWELDLDSLGDYEQFVARHRLVLSPTVEGLDPGLKRWDALRVDSIREPIDAPHGVPPIFAMFNLLKADFLAARWLAYRAIEDPPTESASYGDTLDYAVYGVSGSLLTLAHRSAIDLLDRVAVAASEYFRLPGESRHVYFWNRWHVLDGRRLKQSVEWQPEVRVEIEAGNLAVAALGELAEDIAEGGFLNPQRTLRHVSTHRFAVLHDMGTEPSRTSPHAEHFDLLDFERRTLDALKIARAAILYLTEAIALCEGRLAADGGPVGTLIVPPHHYVRGDNEELHEPDDQYEDGSG